MKIAIVTQEMLCQEEVMTGHDSVHKCYIVDVPDELFPSEVLEAYKYMYSDNQYPRVVISNCWTCNPKV